MSHVKAGGSSKNNRNNPGKRLGVKTNGIVTAGQVIVRQRGSHKLAGDGTTLGKDFTIHAIRDGQVIFQRVKKTRFTGKTVRRTIVTIV